MDHQAFPLEWCNNYRSSSEHNLVVHAMDFAQGWGSESIAGMMKTIVTAFSGILSLLLAYLLWAAADNWVLHRERKGPVQWPILGISTDFRIDLFAKLTWPHFI